MAHVRGPGTKPLAGTAALRLPLPVAYSFISINILFLVNARSYGSRMDYPRPTIPRLQFTEGTDQRSSSRGSQRRSLHSTSIHVLDDDALLRIFYLYRPSLVMEGVVDTVCLLQGGQWDRERWWYRLAQVCRRWRYIIHDSATHLDLRLVCTYGTPVAEMLANSPPLPLIIDYVKKGHDLTAEDEGDIVLALQHRDRVRRIRLWMLLPNLQRLLVAMDEEFPMLEYLYVAPLAKHDLGLALPRTFQAPHLRHLVLRNFTFARASPLLTTATGLVTLALQRIHPSSYLCPNVLLQRLSLMPQLETLGIIFHSPIPNRLVERQLSHMPVMMHITLPNLRWFAYGGVSAYLEALLPRITAPLLEKLKIFFFNQLNFSVPCLLRFVNTLANLRFHSAVFESNERRVTMKVYPREGAKMYALSMCIGCRHLDWQVSSTAQIFDALSPVFSAVEHLTLKHERHSVPSTCRNEADRTQWRKLLGSFRNMKTLRVPNGLVRELSRSLRSDDGEHILDLVPELKVLEYSAGGDSGGDVFTPFISARQIAGRPVTLVRR